MNRPPHTATRRQFVAGVAAPLLAGLSPAAPQPAAPRNLTAFPNKAVLRQEDFRYIGYYDLDLGGEFSYGQGLTHRYVNGKLRFLALSHATGSMAYELREIEPPASLNTETTNVVGGWGDMWAGRRGSANGAWHGLWWDEERQRLWSSYAIDYPDDNQMMWTNALMQTQLGPNGTVAGVRGPFGLEGVGARRIYGGAVRIPLWFQQAYGVGPYGVGFGGYTSRMAQGLRPSMGPVLIGIPDPAALADEGNVPTSQFNVLMDHVTGTGGTAWYPGAAQPTSFDRGVRTPDADTNYDAWTSPAPDGRGRWTWGDSAYQTGVWIDLPTRHGFVIIPTVHTGRNWYQNSTLNYEGKRPEFQVFDPRHLGEVRLSQRQPWNVKPSAMWRPDWASMGITYGPTGQQGNNCSYTACAATFDETTKRLFVRWTFAWGWWPNTRDRILVFEVNG